MHNIYRMFTQFLYWLYIAIELQKPRKEIILFLFLIYITFILLIKFATSVCLFILDRKSSET